MKSPFPWLIVSLLLAGSMQAESSKPNIVLFYIDDWAWNGTPVPMDDDMRNSFMPVLEMPHVERLAREGMKFRNAYGSPQCSPGRAALQTGQSNPRNGFTVYLGSQDRYFDTQKAYQGFPLVPNIADHELDDGAVSIAEALQPLGYTSAHVGKWHLRGDPGREGYVVHDGDTTNTPGNTLTNGLPPGSPTPRRLPKDLIDPKLMFSVTDKAIGFMEDQVGQGNPFYLQISHYAMHAGRECLDKTREKYLQHPLVKAWYAKENQDPATIRRNDDPAIWLGMAEDLDGRIGAVMAKAEELGIADNTYFIVVGDNGYRHDELLLDESNTQPLHSSKWWLWDGGIRVPMIVKGPGIPGGTTFRGNVVNYDFLPTFFEWAGGDPETLHYIDGVSLAPYLAGQTPDSGFLNRNLYFHYPHYRSGAPTSAMISRNLKIMHFYERPDLPMLFDLAVDVGEVTNIARKQPETHARMFQQMMRYLVQVGARFPMVNPDYDEEEYRTDPTTERSRQKWGPFEGSRELAEDEI